MTSHPLTVNVSLNELLNMKENMLTLQIIQKENQQLLKVYAERKRSYERYRNEWENIIKKYEEAMLKLTTLEKQKEIFDNKIKMADECYCDILKTEEKELNESIKSEEEMYYPDDDKEDDTVLEYFGCDSEEEEVQQLPPVIKEKKNRKQKSVKTPKPIKTPKTKRNKTDTPKKRQTKTQIEKGTSLSHKRKKQFYEKFKDNALRETEDLKVSSIHFGDKDKMFSVSYKSILDIIMDRIKQQKSIPIIDNQPAIKIKEIFNAFCFGNSDIQNILITCQESQLVVKKKILQDFVKCIETLQFERTLFHFNCLFQLSKTNSSYLLIVGCDID
ncbi:hypothetical protein EDI_002400 [Entamoeba dispar SAW760]|uniref:Uncharacterized protein n=1 Tax=Entamoeba dispar (strain ATCC PRA-260 / SAW760) TaxID=370354 RepID=B0EJ79_ENTDS|nr:uncharacterized protein EDI_002400 [Entamoeba dispar SAW760]EDR25387.1 hypothetical protein EDI_002400 [Entamoeba dispar SAW760]|eukprot:EDR25387.1 hypothetical protein EDI_002400 [Entamoeba dispar SAW760]